MASSEMKGFVFAVTFIVLFGVFLSTVPSDLQGQGGTGDLITPINPSLLSDFESTADFEGETGDFFGITGTYYYYDLPVGGTTFECGLSGTSFYVAKHVLFLGIWLGGYDFTNFVSENGTNYGTTVSYSDIENDAVDGAVRYELHYEGSGNAAGGFIIYWNETTYTGPEDAWDNDKLQFLHGIGITADINIASLLLQLLFFQLPDVPLLLGIILATPLWAMIIYITWFIIISMIPFLGGA